MLWNFSFRSLKASSSTFIKASPVLKQTCKLTHATRQQMTISAAAVVRPMATDDIEVLTLECSLFGVQVLPSQLGYPVVRIARVE